MVADCSIVPVGVTSLVTHGLKLVNIQAAFCVPTHTKRKKSSTFTVTISEVLIAEVLTPGVVPGRLTYMNSNTLIEHSPLELYSSLFVSHDQWFVLCSV